jgi:uncharacterized protein (TIGR00725 family)
MSREPDLQRPGGGRRPAYIGVIGENEPPPHLLEAAEAVGRCVAEAGAIVVCGGLGGVMEAACRGAQAAGGITIGILPGSDRRQANPYLTYAIPTGLGYVRNILVVRSADAVIAVGGKFGTLSEIAYAMIEGRPLFGLETWTLGRADLPDPIVRAASPRDAVAKAVAALGRGAD